MSSQFVSEEIKNTINLYFDNALNKEEEIELLEKVNNNPFIEKMLNEEKKFRNKLKYALGRIPASSMLVDAIRNQINDSQ